MRIGFVVEQPVCIGKFFAIPTPTPPFWPGFGRIIVTVKGFSHEWWPDFGRILAGFWLGFEPVHAEAIKTTKTQRREATH